MALSKAPIRFLNYSRATSCTRSSLLQRGGYGRRTLAYQSTRFRQYHEHNQRRSYSSAGDGHESGNKSSEIPWIVGSLAVTIPSFWFLVQPQLNKATSHGHDNAHGASDHDGDQEEHSSKEDDSAEESESESTSEDNDHASPDVPEESTDSQEDAQEGSTANDESADTTADHAGSQASGVPAKIQGHKRLIQDPKGGTKVRFDSPNAKVIGQTDDEDTDPAGKDMGATSKESSNITKMSGKQAGMSNTDTKHSTDPGTDPSKSKKADGVPETAKLKGTVDSNRPFR